MVLALLILYCCVICLPYPNFRQSNIRLHSKSNFVLILVNEVRKYVLLFEDVNFTFEFLLSSCDNFHELLTLNLIVKFQIKDVSIPLLNLQRTLIIGL